MTFANQLQATKDVPFLSPGPSSNSHPAFGWKSIFTGPNGLRAGWRLLIFAVLVVILLGSFVLIRAGGVQGVREAKKHTGPVT